MEHEFLGDRRHALEEAFFTKMNAELKQKLAESHAVADRKRALMEHAGVCDDQLAEHLARLGMHPGHVAAIEVVPYVMVAWANHHVDDNERRTILELAADAGISQGSAAADVLQHWLQEDPGESVYEAWRESVAALHRDLPDDVRRAEAERAFRGAERVAKSSGGFLTMGAVSPAERARLDLIRATLSL